ncbi:serine/threonine protein kinase [Pseudarthrobacter sp. J1763]|uniref:serine/threonine protein kinase n=1 Tax=Pseudarthrobacter sp. J1763 TaxID=3420445 RepID=UPI003D2A92DB
MENFSEKPNSRSVSGGRHRGERSPWPLSAGEASQETSLQPEVPGYEVIRRLGVGSTATVWLVRNSTGAHAGKLFALKCPHPGLDIAGDERYTVVQREAAILGNLEHQHLVKIHDVIPLGGQDDGAFALLMDYAAGGSLTELIASRGSLSSGETATILTPLAQALEYLHAAGLTHSDVSASNVLFTADGCPLLTDLGVGRMLGEPGSQLWAGTPGFADPATYNSTANLRPERDLYSLAAVGWYCLAAQVPEPNNSRPPLGLLVPDVAPGLVAAIEAGLKLDPKQRPAAGEFAHAIYRSARCEPVDLSASVHASVVPDLMTRIEPNANGRRRWAALYPGARFAAGKGRKRSLRRGFAGLDLAHGGLAGVGHAGNGRVVATVVTAALVLGGGGATVWAISTARHTAELQTGKVTGGSNAEAVESAKLASGISAETGTQLGLDAGAVQQLNARLAAVDPVQAAKGITELRDLALSYGKVDLLARVNSPNSSAAKSDAQLAAQLRNRGHALKGFSTELKTSALEQGSNEHQAKVKILAVTSAYQEVDAAGKVVAQTEHGVDQSLVLALTRKSGTWLIEEVQSP